MNSKPQQIKMQSTKKGAVTKREEGVPPLGLAAGGPPAGDEAPSTAAAPPTPTALQPSVSEGKSISCSCLQFRLDLGMAEEKERPFISRQMRPSFVC